MPELGNAARSAPQRWAHQPAAGDVSTRRITPRYPGLALADGRVIPLENARLATNCLQKAVDLLETERGWADPDESGGPAPQGGWPIGGLERGRTAVLTPTRKTWRIDAPMGSTVVIDSVGMSQLARLVTSVGREIASVDLAEIAGRDGPGPSANLGALFYVRRPCRFMRMQVGGKIRGNVGARRFLGVIVVGVMAAVLVVGSWSGEGRHWAAAVPVSGDVWVRRPDSGRLLSVDGSTGRVQTEIFVGAWENERPEVVPVGSSVVVWGPRQGRVAGVSSATWEPKKLQSPGAGLSVVAGGSTAWLLSEAGAAQQVDGERLEPVGVPVEVGSRVFGAAAVDERGVLWVLGPSGSLSSFRDGQRFTAAPVGPVGLSSVVVIVAGRPVVVDPSAGRMVVVDPQTGLMVSTWPLTVPVGSGVRVASTGERVALVAPAASQLLLADPANGEIAVVGLESPPSSGGYGVPVARDGFVYVPHVGAGGSGEVVVVDVQAQRVERRLPAGDGEVRLFSHGPRVWFTPINSSATGALGGIVTDDRSLIAITALTPRAGEVASSEDRPEPVYDPLGGWGSSIGDAIPEERERECPTRSPDSDCPTAKQLPSRDGRGVHENRDDPCLTRGLIEGCPTFGDPIGLSSSGSGGGGVPSRPGGPLRPGVEHPPTLAAAFDWRPRDPTVGQAVTFTDTTPGSHKVTRWEFERGTPPVSADAEPRVLWSRPGSYRVTLFVDGAAPETRTVPVAPPGFVALPPIFDKPLDVARGLLEDAGLVPGGTSYRPSRAPKDHIIAATQNQKALSQNASLPYGDTVDLVLSNNKAPLEIMGGRDAGCARFADLTVRCWETDGKGAVNDTTPEALRGLIGIIEFHHEFDRDCSVLLDHTVKCSGTGAYPAELQGRTVSIAGQCALLLGHTIRCWGDNQFGQLGNGTDQFSATPVQAQGISNAAAISGMDGSQCALLDNGTVRCWGWLIEGFTDVHTDGLFPTTLVPTETPGITTAIRLSSVGGAQFAHACVLLKNGRIECWGNNENGRLGDGTYLDTAVPIELPGISNAIDMKVSGHSSCALVNNGSVYCWGVGFGTSFIEAQRSSTPVRIQRINNAIAVSDGGIGGFCAILGDDSIICWSDENDAEPFVIP